MNKKAQDNPWWVIGVGAILAIIMVYGIVSINANVGIDEIALGAAIGTTIANEIAPLLVTPEPETVEDVPVEEEVGSTIEEEILDIVSEEDRQEDFARGLFEEEIEDKSFKQILQDIINAELAARNSSSEVESWRDIDVVKVTDLDIDVSGDDADIDAEIKVWFFLDGDDDDEDREKAKFEVSLEVIDLEVDDDFDDAEIDDYDEENFEFVKFYSFPF